MEVRDPLSDALSALAHPARRGMLERLAEGDASVSDLAEPLNMSLPAVSKHIRILERAGLIEQRQRAQFRICTLVPAPLKDIESWAEQYRSIWEARFDQMETVMKKISKKAEGN